MSTSSGLGWGIELHAEEEGSFLPLNGVKEKNLFFCKLCNPRKYARSEKNWVKADLLREEIKKRGWIVEDTKDGQRLKAK